MPQLLVSVAGPMFASCWTTYLFLSPCCKGASCCCSTPPAGLEADHCGTELGGHGRSASALALDPTVFTPMSAWCVSAGSTNFCLDDVFCRCKRQACARDASCTCNQSGQPQGRADLFQLCVRVGPIPTLPCVCEPGCIHAFADCCCHQPALLCGTEAHLATAQGVFSSNSCCGVAAHTHHRLLNLLIWFCQRSDADFRCRI